MLKMFENINHFIPKDVIVINLFVCKEFETSCYVRKNTTSNKDLEGKKNIECKKEKENEKRITCAIRRRRSFAMF
jgi:hypothetical protein